MEKRKEELLANLVEELKKAEDLEETSLFTAEELGADADIVRTLITEMGTDLIAVLGEFFFMPYEDDEMLFFSTVITISEELPKVGNTDISAAVARINSILPCGCFALADGGERLIYRYTVPVLSWQDEKGQETVMLTAANAAIETVDRFVGYLSLVIGGEMSPDGMMELAVGKGGAGTED